MKWLIKRKDGASHYEMMVFTISPGGEIPLHTHKDMEHEIFIIAGEGILNTGNEEIAVKKGNAILIQPGEKHGFINTGKELFSFICVIPII